MALTNTAVSGAKPRERSYKLYDERGLFLSVEPSGAKLWRLKYRYAGKEKKLALGSYPESSLKDARNKRDEARKQLDNGIDPASKRRADRLGLNDRAKNTFGAVANEYIEKKEREGLAAITIGKAKWLLGLLESGLRGRPIAEITAQELLGAIRKVEKQGNLETARRMRSLAGRVFRYGVATGRAERDLSVDIRDALTTPKVTHRAAILDARGVGALMRAIEGYIGQPSTRYALQMAPHVFVRPGELRYAEWTEVDLEKAVWTIPGRKMKMGRDHHVPLSRQVLGILEVAKKLSNDAGYVFPSASSWKRPISENTVNGALRRMGYTKDQMTGHGFRAMASSLLNESGLWNPDAIERALAHGDTNAVRSAYHRSSYWDERVRMAQWWSDYISTLRDGAAVLRLRVDLLWGMRDPTEKTAVPLNESEKILGGLTGSALTRVQLSPISSGSHAKVLIYDEKATGDWVTAIGSCNFLSSLYTAVEISVACRSQALGLRMVSELIYSQLPASGSWSQTARRLNRLWEAMRFTASGEPEIGSHSLTLLCDQDHYACVRAARDLAKSEIAIGCDLYGMAAETSVLVPMGRAAELGRKVNLLYHRPSKALDNASWESKLAASMPEGVSIRRVPNLHGKFLWWDDRNLAISSFNWLSTVASDTRARGAEFGVLISGPGLVEILKTKLARHGVEVPAAFEKPAT